MKFEMKITTDKDEIDFYLLTSGVANIILLTFIVRTCTEHNIQCTLLSVKI